MMRAVVDTNILIRALIKPDGTVGPILKRLSAGDYTLVYSEPILLELLAKLALPRLRHKYHIDDLVVEQTLALIALRGEPITPERHVKVCREPKDDMFIEAALAGAAPYVVTGDEDLLILKRFESVRFVTPSTFLKAL